MLKNDWIRETKGLKELITQWRDDEKRHHQALRNLTRVPFFRIDEIGSDSFIALFQGWEKLEERYTRQKQRRR